MKGVGWISFANPNQRVWTLVAWVLEVTPESVTLEKCFWFLGGKWGSTST